MAVGAFGSETPAPDKLLTFFEKLEVNIFTLLATPAPAQCKKIYVSFPSGPIKIDEVLLESTQFCRQLSYSADLSFALCFGVKSVNFKVF